MTTGAPTGEPTPKTNEKSADQKFKKISPRRDLKEQGIEDEQNESGPEKTDEKEPAPNCGRRDRGKSLV